VTVLAALAVLVLLRPDDPSLPPLDSAAAIAEIDGSASSTSTRSAVLLLARQQDELSRRSAEATPTADARVPALLALALVYAVAVVITQPRADSSLEADVLHLAVVDTVRELPARLSHGARSSGAGATARRSLERLWVEVTTT
jgi:hypothetical protein